MTHQPLTIKELTDVVGSGITPRMVRHYHQLGLLPPVQRSAANYRLYTLEDVQRLRWIAALKQQGFQLSHIKKLLASTSAADATQTLTYQLQQQYQTVIQQLARLRQTASALERFLGRDDSCQERQSHVLTHLQQLDVDTQSGQLEHLWDELDGVVDAHPEKFEESLQKLLPDLSHRSEIEVDLLSKLVLACGDVSITQFVRLSRGAIAAARHTLKAGCEVIADVPTVTATLDQTRLAHLGCTVKTLIDDAHINSAPEAEQAFWHNQGWAKRLQQVSPSSILVIGYTPSVLMSVCAAIEQGKIQPALVIGMPIGFSHAPAAKLRLMRCSIPWITIAGTMGGGLLAAVALNALVGSLLEKPNCHCYLGTGT